ncbi:39S ribosomal protein L33, mitochondrial [Myotis davidii]|uniref:Large ribosomal subunit protein bL33m n=1 Tax=Myotis davidii TaxID=225400 RepID=L5LMU0_MYODS|nr:39S ribosomal protein L33, mitochondrial [Myotis davidii]
MDIFLFSFNLSLLQKVAKSKSKNILVRMVSQAGTGFSFNTKRSRLREKLTLLHYDPFGKIQKSYATVKSHAFKACCSFQTDAEQWQVFGPLTLAFIQPVCNECLLWCQSLFQLLGCPTTRHRLSPCTFGT